MDFPIYFPYISHILSINHILTIDLRRLGRTAPPGKPPIGEPPAARIEVRRLGVEDFFMGIFHQDGL